MKKDHPLRMINAGRYKVCFSELSPEIQNDVLKRMARLIDENHEWYDQGNYGHLCNILPTLAIDKALQASGKTPEESLEILSNYMWGALKPEKMQRLALSAPKLFAKEGNCVISALSATGRMRFGNARKVSD